MTTQRTLRAFAAIALVLAFGAAYRATVARAPAHASQPAAAALSLSTTTPDTYWVQKVVDGDTIDIYMNGKTTRLRLIGMDTPEVADPRKPVQCFGREASAEGHKLMDNSWVRIESDAVSGTTDKYGRTLAYVFLMDGTFYNEFMIRNGYAHEYDYNNQKYKYRSAFKSAQAQAKKELLGFWSPQTCDGNTTKPAGAS